jgi:hypothetical protein
MKSSPDLHRLIKSMSMSEKRHFKLFTAGHVGGDSKNFRLLFDAIAKQEEYDEEKIKKEFAHTGFIKHLPAEKNHLYARLLESLNAFNRERTFLSRHAGYMASIELLFNRGLFSQCAKLIRKAKAEAYSLEKFSALLIVLRWETLIYINNEDAKNLNRGLREEVRILDIMKIQTLLMQIAFNVQIQIDKGKVPESFVNETLLGLKKHYPKRADYQSFWVKYYYQSALGLVYTIRNQHLKRYECFKAIKNIMDSAPQFIKDLPAIYHSNSNNLVNVMCFLGKYEEAKIIVRRQKEFLGIYNMKRPALEKIIFLNTSESELFLFYKTKKYPAGAAFVKEIEAKVKKVELNFNPVLFDLFYMMAVNEFMVNNFKLSLRWLNKILNAERETRVRKELQINARLLYLLVLFGSKDILFENRLASTRRFIQQDPQFHYMLPAVDAIRILSDPKRWMRNTKPVQKSQNANSPGGDFSKLISRIKKESRRANEEALNKQFDFAEWLEKKFTEAIA